MADDDRVVQDGVHDGAKSVVAAAANLFSSCQRRAVRAHGPRDPWASGRSHRALFIAGGDELAADVLRRQPPAGLTQGLGLVSLISTTAHPDCRESQEQLDTSTSGRQAGLLEVEPVRPR
jgi:hypothetical protein